MFNFLKEKIQGLTKSISKSQDQKQKTKKQPSILTKVKKAVVGEVTLSETEIEEFLWDFELALLEGDVAHDVAVKICEDIKNSLVGKKFSRSQDISDEVESAVKAALVDVLTSVPVFNILEKAKAAEKPFVIMLLGPNGAGKTTSLAKLANLFLENGLSCTLAASDTFRAASIEQLKFHADKLGIRMIKHDYGADPAAVAFDAIKSARANKIDCVLIDTAGRQETNKNLMAEIAKISKVCTPDLKIYVDEALAGNVLIDRVLSFKDHVGVDGIILTKMDVDVKGGGAISVSFATQTPVILIGTGQSYSDLQQFKPEEVVKRLFD